MNTFSKVEQKTYYMTLYGFLDHLDTCEAEKMQRPKGEPHEFIISCQVLEQPEALLLAEQLCRRVSCQDINFTSTFF